MKSLIPKGGHKMKRYATVAVILCAALLIALPLFASVADDVKAKKPMTDILQNGILAGLSWEEVVFQAIQAGADPSEVIVTALNMGADPQQVVKGAKRAQVSDQVIRSAFAKAQESGGLYGGRAGVQPLMPIAPNYSTGGGGGGIPGSPFR